jgi:hypothetical protein
MRKKIIILLFSFLALKSENFSHRFWGEKSEKFSFSFSHRETLLGWETLPRAQIDDSDRDLNYESNSTLKTGLENTSSGSSRQF